MIYMLKIINKFENFAELYEIELQDVRIIKMFNQS